ncbi:undecaprenyldiphospho-muramoylpentapeptide beta-N-acetylglucosaminyltransferase [Faecalibacter macacae]|uniref:UDP-N-acetylglucosamine--N-acetylmuramyl-(pentapeptide) pyrophosphoryl-undecaprenol N-acetylglucosamine transferase n=1 Tax=Faecalibacter macacae TaxID=1859289 RepID=A0A3L9MG62_9FLAO|nr:undecaprenyldiphospho-muramoylpentapeptide beta-N-acetylglucosaminyltransferase [Faecalibacter macacae]RLZ11943.1 undecaprenyldiphospho-muramoylpentapeptide beta-N-acetylglucosaminyltransferase [Faecalibacter macacae]
MEMTSKTSPKVLISGGGTGGHIYPAIAIADEIKRRLPNAEILFVGADSKMEMEKVPKAGYAIKGLPIAGFDRSNMKANFSFPFKVIKSVSLAKKIYKDFKPDLAVGTGGYASGPMLWVAGNNNVPYVLQEQNSFPGVTNKILKNKAAAICTAYEGIAQFPAEKVHYTGNPIRSEIFQNLPSKEEAIKGFNLDPNKPTVLSVGGSQGSRAMNNAWLENLDELVASGVQLIWQTGKSDFPKISKLVGDKYPTIHVTEFIYNMKDAYAAADTIVSRAGAMAISELSIIGKPTILIPLPSAAEDHQTKNAMALVNQDAAILVNDAEAKQKLVKEVIALAVNDDLKNKLSTNIKAFGKPNATKEIVDILLNLL